MRHVIACENGVFEPGIPEVKAEGGHGRGCGAKV